MTNPTIGEAQAAAYQADSRTEYWKDRAEFFEAASRRYYRGLANIMRHADYPAGEEWEAAYNEVVEFARAVARVVDRREGLHVQPRRMDRRTFR